MMTYDKLSGKLSACKSLTGLSVADFDALYDDFAARRANAERIRQELATRFAQTGTVTADNLRKALQPIIRVLA